MRRRVFYNWVFAFSLTALWLCVVFVYSVGTSRRQFALAARIDAFEKRIFELESRPSASPSSPVLESSPSTPPWRPRIVGSGRTHSPLYEYRYYDFEASPTGGIRRQYVKLGPYNPP